MNTNHWADQYVGKQYPGWALAYVESEQPIPESWREAFYDDLTDVNWLYVNRLEQAIKEHGVRWTE